MVVSFMVALGGSTLLYNLLYYIPPFNSMRYPVKFLFLFFVVIAITTGLGFDKLKEGVDKKDRTTKTVVYIVFYTGFLLTALWGYINLFDADVYRFLDANGFKPKAYNDIWFNIHSMKRFLFFSFMFCTMLFVYLNVKKYKKLVLYSIPVILVADLFLANYGFYRTASWQLYMSKHTFIENLTKNKETERYYTTEKTYKEFEDFPYDRAALSPAYASIFGLYTVWGAEVLRVSNYEHFLNLIKRTPTPEAAKRLFDISGVRYVITSNKMDDKDFRLLKDVPVKEKNAYLYEYLLYPGRFLMFTRVIYVDDTKAAIEKLADSTIDLRSTLILIDKDKKQKGGKGGLVGTATLVSYNANKMIIECEAKTDAFLYVSDTWYPGWKAYIDGKQAKIYRANLAFRAVEVPAGKHVVIFKYVPLSFYIGLCFTLIGIGLSIYLVKRDRKCKDKTKESKV